MVTKHQSPLRCETLNEKKILMPFELKTKKLVANDGVNFCFEASLKNKIWNKTKG